MIPAFDFTSAGRIRFGSGLASKLPELVAKYSQFVFLVTGRDESRTSELRGLLKANNLVVHAYSVDGEPTTTVVLEALAEARQAGAGVVVSVGGGSVIDVGKAVSALLTNCDDLMDYLEVVGRSRPLEEPAAPFIAVPTTAGTGSEVTRNAVMQIPEHGVKVSLRSGQMLPRLALIDPELTHSMPPAVTAATGLDALTQLVEPLVSVGANPVTDALCREGIALVRDALLVAWRDGNDAEARERMSLASLFGGLALANARLGAAHGFAGPIGGRFATAPHGVICARMLPQVMETNIRALKERKPNAPALDRYREVARILTGDRQAKTVDGIIHVQSLCTRLEVPFLSEFGIGPGDYADLVEKARKSSSMQGNPIKLTREELTGILSKAVEGS